MANILSVKIRDYSGNEKSHPVYFDDAASYGQIQAWATAALPDLDADIDGVIIDAVVTLAIDLPAGMKSTAVNGNRVREGANLTYDCTGTEYVDTLFVPTWANSSFAGDVVNETDVSGDYIYDLHNTAGVSGGVQPTDQNGFVHAAYVKGVRAFRK